MTRKRILFEVNWERAGGVLCPSCRKETLRFINGLCPQCARKAEERTNQELEIKELVRSLRHQRAINRYS